MKRHGEEGRPSTTAERKIELGLAVCRAVFPQPLQKTVHPPEGLTPKAKEKWLEEEAALFERQCRNEPLPVDKSITLAAYTAYWLAHIAPGKLAKSTLARDKQDIDRFLPTLGSYKLTDLLLSDSRISNTMWFTVRYAVVSVAGTLLISMVLALAMNNVSRRVSGMFRTLYYLPAILSGLAIGLIWNQLFSNGLPQIGSLLNIPWLSKNILGDVNLAFWGVAFTGFWGGVATPTLLLLASLQNIPKDILESAALDGANAFQAFLRIKLPYMLYTISLITILTLKGALTTFEGILVLTGGGPARSTESLGLLMYNYAFKEFRAGYSNAISILVLVVVGLISILQIRASQKLEVEG